MPLLVPPLTQTIRRESVREPLLPTLAFPSVWWNEGPPPADVADHVSCPERNDQAYRRDRRFPTGSTAFISALRTARMLRVVDLKFDASDGAESLERTLSRSSILTVRLLTGRCPNADQWCARVRQLLAASGKSTIPDIQWKTSLQVALVLKVHHRFAIVDDELWHFEATVGGSHRSLNAYSRGWDACMTRAGEFFDEAWNYA